MHVTLIVQGLPHSVIPVSVQAIASAHQDSAHPQILVNHLAHRLKDKVPMILIATVKVLASVLLIFAIQMHVHLLVLPLPLLLMIMLALVP